MRVLPALGLVAMVLLAPGGCSSGPRATGERAASPAPDVPRGLFVTRWDFRTIEDIERIVRETKEAGFSELYWQVRGQADAFYASDLEPWGEEISGDGQGPGFDPLLEAVRAAHERGLKLHAWMNTLTLWHGSALPENPGHLRAAHPEWRLVSSDGAAVRTRDRYELVNPLLPEVRAHLDAVTGDIAGRYEVDGVCFDTLRLPSGAEQVPGDPVSRRLFAVENADELGAGTDRARVAKAWVLNRMNQTAAGLVRAAHDARPGIVVSLVAVGAAPAVAMQQDQDAAAWIEAGADRVLFLNATDTLPALEQSVRAWAQISPKGADRVGPAIVAATQHDPEVLASQLKGVSRSTPCVIFSFASLFETADAAVARDPRSTALRSARRDAVVKVLAPPKPRAAEPKPGLSDIKGVSTEEKEAKTAEKKKAKAKAPKEETPTEPAEPAGAGERSDVREEAPAGRGDSESGDVPGRDDAAGDADAKGVKKPLNPKKDPA